MICPTLFDDTFASDVRDGLTRGSKRLFPRNLYDQLGSLLFEAITALPEYYLTRAEAAILATHAGDIAAALPSPIELHELGCGSARKTRLLIEALLRRQGTLRYRPIDVSESAVADAASLLRSCDGLRVDGFVGSYQEAFASERMTSTLPVMTAWLGSSIGNHERDEAVALLRALAATLKLGDLLLLGADICRDPQRLIPAYDDATGVTAAFIRNSLGRINRELGGAFDLRAFRHVVLWDAERSAVDAYLEARRAMRVSIRALDLEIPFADGEHIHVESSYKFPLATLEEILKESGFALTNSWSCPSEEFVLLLAARQPGRT